MIILAEHFVRAPQWTWYILFYFLFAGLAGGAYVVATLLRLSGDPRDESAARIGFYVSLPATIICPILLTADLGVSWTRFWHMLVDVTPGDTGLNFKYWSPMSVGAWGLLVFGVFAFVSAAEAWLSDRRGSPVLPLVLNRAFNVVGALVGARGHFRVQASGGSAVIGGVRLDTVVVSLLVLLGVVALRAAVIFSAQ